MSRSKKFLDKVRRNPKDVPWEMAIKILSDYGFELINPRRGSHYKATHPSLPGRVLIVPRPHPPGPLPSYKIREILELIDDLEGTI